MKKSHRRVLSPLVVVASLAMVLTGCSTSNLGGDKADPSASANGPIKIGAVLDITGVGASLGVPEQNTLNMLAKQLEKAGGINGRQVQLLIEDDQSTEDGAAKATTKLIQGENVDLIIGASRTGPSVAMRPIAEAAGLPMISIAANAVIVKDSKWVFKTAQNDVVVIQRILDDAKAKGYTKLALVRDATGFGEGVADTITKLGASLGITLVMTESFEPSATDFTPQMTNVRVYQSHGIANAAFFAAAGDAATGVIAPMGRLLVVDQLKADNPQRGVIEKFNKDYSAMFGDKPSSFAGHAFDAWNIAVASMKKAGTEPEALRNAIEKTEGYVGISGIFKMTPTDHSGLDASALILAQAKNGRWNLYKD